MTISNSFTDEYRNIFITLLHKAGFTVDGSTYEVEPTNQEEAIILEKLRDWDII